MLHASCLTLSLHYSKCKTKSFVSHKNIRIGLFSIIIMLYYTFLSGVYRVTCDCGRQLCTYLFLSTANKEKRITEAVRRKWTLLLHWRYRQRQGFYRSLGAFEVLGEIKHTILLSIICIYMLYNMNAGDFRMFNIFIIF